MLYVAIILFLIAASFGLYMLSRWLANQATFPKAIVLSHGTAAAVGLILLIIFAVRSPGSYPLAAIVLFIIAALGGAYMAYRDWIQKKQPVIPLAFVHALLAVSALIALLIFVFG